MTMIETNQASKQVVDKAGLDVRGLYWFLLIAFGWAWALDAGLWLSGQGVSGQWSLPVLVLSMFGPAIAAFVVTRWLSPISHIVAATGLRFGAKGSRWGWYYLFALLAMPLLFVAALFVGAALGVYQMDLTGYSAYRQLLESTPQGSQLLQQGQVPLAVVVWTQIASLPVAGLINLPFAFGEEYGWRGYLLPALLPLGQWPALVLHGLVWGLWHAPVILMGYNYPQHPITGVFAMVVFTTLLGIIFGWTRLATGSVWPATIMHANLNASSGVALLLMRAGTNLDTLHATLLGWSGWILLVVVIGMLIVTGRLPVRHLPDHLTALQQN
jgi:membrane protease YdiL (CAAX protease family)